MSPFHHDLHATLNDEALRQQTKAVSSLSRKISEDQSSFQFTLITCLLFIWLDFLRNDYKSSLKHLKSGLRILQDAQLHPHLINKADPAILPLFQHLKIQVAIHECLDSDSDSDSIAVIQETGEFFCPNS